MSYSLYPSGVEGRQDATELAAGGKGFQFVLSVLGSVVFGAWSPGGVAPPFPTYPVRIWRVMSRVFAVIRPVPSPLNISFTNAFYLFLARALAR